MAKAVLAKAARARFKHRFESGFGYRYRAGEAHVRGRRADCAFGHIGDHRRYQRIAQALRDGGGEHFDTGVVLADHHKRPVLFGATDGNENGGGAGRDARVNFGPGQLFNGVWRRARVGRKSGHRQRQDG